MRSSDWSSDVCSSDLRPLVPVGERCEQQPGRLAASEKAEAEDGDDALRLRFTGVEFFQPPHDFARPLGCRARLRLNDSDDISLVFLGKEEIGRASCRERVCQYV